jgi:hypothetical protein
MAAMAGSARWHKQQEQKHAARTQVSDYKQEATTERRWC